MTPVTAKLDASILFEVELLLAERPDRHLHLDDARRLLGQFGRREQIPSTPTLRWLLTNYSFTDRASTWLTSTLDLVEAQGGRASA